MKSKTLLNLAPALLAAFLMGVAGAALAKLPAPTDAEKAAAADKKEKAAAAAAKAKEALSKAQERAVENYKGMKAGAGAPMEKTKK